MALTRGDKMIIIGAVALAATVVLGLAILKKPRLFSGGGEQVATIPPAPTAAAPVPSVQAPIGAVGQSSAPIQAAPAPAVATAPPPPTAAPTPAPPTPTPASPTAAPVATTPPGAKHAPLPTVAGDDTLEKMFAEITSETPAKGKNGKPGDKAAPHTPEPAPATAPAEPVAAPPPSGPTSPDTPAAVETTVPSTVEPVPPPAPTNGQGKGKTKPKGQSAGQAPASAPPAKPAEPVPAPKPAAKAPAKPAAKTDAAPTAASGTVIRIVAEEKPGQYELLIQTNKAPGTFAKMFLTDPPRLVLDVAGAWAYSGPLASDTGDAFIRHIRVGRHPDKFRVVLDMSPDAPARLRGAPTFERVPEGVLLRIPK